MVSVYLAGPMRNYKDFNFPAFTEGATNLRNHGYEVFSPAEHEVSRGFDCHGHDGDLAKFISTTGFNLREALSRDIEWICARADLVVVLSGWEKSKGARAEVATAAALGVPVIPLNKALIRNPPFKDDYLIIDPLRLAFRDMQAITEVDQYLDDRCGKRYKDEPLAQSWARVAKACEEAGEAVKSYIGYTGQNPRKGESGTLSDVLEELADTAFAAIFAIQHFTKDAEVTVEILEEHLQKAVARTQGSKK